jgi:hypothetical protein
MTTTKNDLKDQSTALRHDLLESLHFFMTAKMNMFGARPDPLRAQEAFLDGEEKLRAVIEMLKKLDNQSGD